MYGDVFSCQLVARVQGVCCESITTPLKSLLGVLALKFYVPWYVCSILVGSRESAPLAAGARRLRPGCGEHTAPCGMHHGEGPQMLRVRRQRVLSAEPQGWRGMLLCG
jgi:hypothetical protein